MEQHAHLKPADAQQQPTTAHRNPWKVWLTKCVDDPRPFICKQYSSTSRTPKAAVISMMTTLQALPLQRMQLPPNKLLVPLPLHRRPSWQTLALPLQLPAVFWGRSGLPGPAAKLCSHTLILPSTQPAAGGSVCLVLIGTPV